MRVPSLSYRSLKISKLIPPENLKVEDWMVKETDLLEEFRD